MDNKISIILTDDEFNQINSQIDAVDTAMPFLFNVESEKRQGGFRLGDKNMGFLEKGKDYINQNPEFMPGYYSAEEVVKDAGLSAQLISITRKLRVLADKIEDTASIAGMEALSGVLAYYNAVKQAARNNVEAAETIYDDMSQRFPGRPKK